MTNDKIHPLPHKETIPYWLYIHVTQGLDSGGPIAVQLHLLEYLYNVGYVLRQYRIYTYTRPCTIRYEGGRVNDRGDIPNIPKESHALTCL